MQTLLDYSQSPPKYECKQRRTAFIITKIPSTSAVKKKDSPPLQKMHPSKNSTPKTFQNQKKREENSPQRRLKRWFFQSATISRS